MRQESPQFDRFKAGGGLCSFHAQRRNTHQGLSQLKVSRVCSSWRQQPSHSKGTGPFVVPNSGTQFSSQYLDLFHNVFNLPPRLQFVFRSDDPPSTPKNVSPLSHRKSVTHVHTHTHTRPSFSVLSHSVLFLKAIPTAVLVTVALSQSLASCPHSPSLVWCTLGLIVKHDSIWIWGWKKKNTGLISQ